MTLKHRVSLTASQLVKWSTILWMTTLICDRLYMLHVVYLDESAKLKEEQFLRIKCADPEFYANLARHSDLCQEVQRNANRSLLLYALKQVTATTYLCGSTPCLSYVTDALNWFASLSIPVMLFVGVAALFTPVALVQAARAVSYLLGISSSPIPIHSPFYGTYTGPGGITYGYGTGTGNHMFVTDYDSSYMANGNNNIHCLQNVVRRQQHKSRDSYSPTYKELNDP